MPIPQPKPKVAHRESKLQLSYELSHRIHAAKVYPVSSSNGSAIVVYGYEYGIRILWRGGKAPKSMKKPPVDISGGNGHNNDAVMIIDSYEEEPAAKTLETLNNEPAFEDDEEEYDPSEPYLPIVQHLDLNLGTDVLHLSFPATPMNIDALSADTFPPILGQKLVIAAACSDCSIRVITLPLDPPPPADSDRDNSGNGTDSARAGSGRWGEDMLTISRNAGHQTIPSGLSITFTARRPKRGGGAEHTNGDEGESRNSRSGSTRRAASRSRSRSRLAGEKMEWDLLLASHSQEISGLLLIFRIPIMIDSTKPKETHKISTDHIIPFQTQHLLSPASNIAFSTSLYPSKRHSQLLVPDSKGALRIYQCLTSQSRHASTRRDSEDEESAPEQGSWLITFYTGFESSKPSGSGSIKIPRRKQIVDAKWVYNGAAIIVLLSDGEWGVWDIEGIGPAAKESLLDKNRGQSGIIGGALTQFSLRGWIENLPSASSLIRNSSDGRSAERSRLAPMTPGTRRVKEEALFSGPAPNAGSSARGGINIRRVAGQSTGKGDDDAVVLWYDGQVISIPSLVSYWAKETSKSGGPGSLFNLERQDKIVKVKGLDIRGELNCGVNQFPAHPSSWVEGSDRSVTSCDLLVTGEHRFIILADPPSEVEQQTISLQLEKRAPIDQQLLAAGELDVDGMDRVLASMANGDYRNGDKPNGVIAKKRVGFVRSR